MRRDRREEKILNYTIKNMNNTYVPQLLGRKKVF